MKEEKMNLWSQFGFTNNLYATPPLQGTLEGSDLLVGRDSEVARLHLHWSSLDTHASIEGENGVGKTSLVMVSAYRALENYSLGRSKQLILPLVEPFQLTAGENIEARALFVIAQSIIKYSDAIKAAGHTLPKLGEVEKWINDPMLKSGGGSLSVLGLGGGGSYSQSANAGGFSTAGFREIVRLWLSMIFPDKSDGSFIGVIDNLELLETSQEARRTLEGMRDTVLALPGVKWVLCGANGIVRSSVGSQRLTGVIGSPITLQPLTEDDIPNVIERRVRAYRNATDATPPVDPAGFAFLYKVVGRNLRIALKHAQDFSLWMAANQHLHLSSGERTRLLETWLADQAALYESDTRTITPTGWSLFDGILNSGGSCSPGDFPDFGFNSQPAMRPYVKQLEDANLVHSTVDESDQRRRTIVVTANGWLVRYKRAGYAVP